MIRKQILLRAFLLFFLILLVSCQNQATITTPINTPSQLSTFTPLFSSTPDFITITPSPLPTQATIPIITPDAIQVERWREYQTELAKLVLSQAGTVSPYYKEALCEWDILGKSNQKVYVWAKCFAPNAGNTKPALIHLANDGSIQKVEVPYNGSSWDSTIQKLFPLEVQEKINEYFNLDSLNLGRPEELRLHLLYRTTHPEEPPLVVLSASSAP